VTARRHSIDQCRPPCVDFRVPLLQPSIMPATVHQLDDVVASLGQREYFTNRFARQDRGEGVVLVAWVDGRPVGAKTL